MLSPNPFFCSASCLKFKTLELHKIGRTIYLEVVDSGNFGADITS